jgi:hypothetical protein
VASPAAGVDFDRNRLSQGELIAGIGGLVLLISMFLDWYGAKVKTSIGNFGAGFGGPNAWESFSLIDIIIFIVALIAIGVAVLRALDNMPDMPYPPATLLTVAGAIAFLLILFRLIVQPFDVPDQVDVTRSLGIWIGLLSAAAITYGGWRAMQESGASFGDLGAGGRARSAAPAAGGGGAAAASPTAPTTPMPAGEPGVPGGGAAGVSPGKEGPGAPHPGTSTGAPGEKGGGPTPASAGADPVPGETAGQTPPGIAGEPPRDGGTQPPGL